MNATTPRDLQVTFRDGRLMAAYLHLRKELKGHVVRSRREPEGMVVDFDDRSQPVGIEFIAPTHVMLAKVNALLTNLGYGPASADELWPLLHGANAGTAVP